MAADFFLKRGDTAPAIAARLLDADESPVNIVGAAVEFHMREVGADVLVTSAPAAIVNGVEGRVRYDWIVGDTLVAGDYEAEFQVTFVGGEVETFPNRSHLRVRINDDLGD